MSKVVKVVQIRSRRNCPCLDRVIINQTSQLIQGGQGGQGGSRKQYACARAPVVSLLFFDFVKKTPDHLDRTSIYAGFRFDQAL